MKEYKVKVVMLSTEKVFDKNINSQIVIHNGTLKFCQSGGMLKESKPQHIYITVSQDVEPIKEGDWYIDDANIVRQSITSDKDYWGVRQDYVKIIATTDPNLTITKSATGYTETRSRTFTSTKPIPQLQQSFLKEFVANPDGKWEVEYYNVIPQSNGTRTDGKIFDEIALNNSLNTLQVFKLNQDNTVNITSMNKCLYDTPKSCENSECRVLNKCNGDKRIYVRVSTTI